MRSNEPVIYTQEQVAAWGRELEASCSLEAIAAGQAVVKAQEEDLRQRIAACDDQLTRLGFRVSTDSTTGLLTTVLLLDAVSPHGSSSAEADCFSVLFCCFAVFACLDQMEKSDRQARAKAILGQGNQLVLSLNELTRKYRELEARRAFIQQHLKPARQLLEGLQDAHQEKALCQDSAARIWNAILKFEREHPAGQSPKVGYWLAVVTHRIKAATQGATSYQDLCDWLWQALEGIPATSDNEVIRERMADLIHQKKCDEVSLDGLPNYLLNQAAYQQWLSDSLQGLILAVRKNGSPAAQPLANEIAHAVKKEKHPDLKFYLSILGHAACVDGRLDPRMLNRDYNPTLVIPISNRQNSMEQCLSFDSHLNKGSDKRIYGMLLILLGVALIAAAVGLVIVSHGGVAPAAVPVIVKGIILCFAGLGILSCLAGGGLFCYGRPKGVRKALSDFNEYHHQKKSVSVSSAVFKPPVNRVDQLLPAFNPAYKC